MARAQKHTKRLNIGMTEEGLAKLDELRYLVGKAIGKHSLSISQIGAWGLHYIFSLPGDNQMVKAIITGMEREEAKLNGSGNPGNPNGSGRPVLVGAGGGERVLPPRPVPGSIKRRGGKLAQSHQAIPAAEF